MFYTQSTERSYYGVLSVTYVYPYKWQRHESRWALTILSDKPIEQTNLCFPFYSIREPVLKNIRNLKTKHRVVYDWLATKMVNAQRFFCVCHYMELHNRESLPIPTYFVDRVLFMGIFFLNQVYYYSGRNTLEINRRIIQSQPKLLKWQIGSYS